MDDATAAASDVKRYDTASGLEGHTSPPAFGTVKGAMFFPPGTFATPPAPPPLAPRPRPPKGAIPAIREGAPDPDDKLPAHVERDPDHTVGRRKRGKKPATPEETVAAIDGEPAAKGPRPRDPGPSPVRAIGLRGGAFFLFDCMGQMREIGAQALGQGSPIAALFGGDVGMEWLRNRFPHYDREGVWTGGFNVRDCGHWLMGECVRKGLFDPDKLPIRGHGVWIAQGVIAVHTGNKVLFMTEPPEERAAGFRDRGALWPALAELTPPAPALSAELAQQVERMFTKWHWWHLGEEKVFTGLWSAGLLGAAINWRVHGLLVGPPGSGKSTLLELYAALSPLAMPVNDYTAAGVRQLLTGRAAPLILDEADEDPETMGRLQQVISLLRRASGGEGARVVRGTGDGKAIRSDFMSPAMLGSVLAPPLMPQDATRITKMELVRIPEGAPTLPIDAMMTWARNNAAALWGRAIDGIPRFRVNLSMMKAALLSHGCSPRLGDQLGTILAARAMMMEDEPLDARAAEEDALSVSWLMQTMDQAAEDGGPARCLSLLLASEAGLTEGGERPTFSELIARALQSPSDLAAQEMSNQARRKLVKHGIKLRGYPALDTRPESLLIARAHPALTKVFAGTLWAGGRWAEDMKHLAGASFPPDQISFATGIKHRVVAIPPEHFGGMVSDQPPPPAPPDCEDVAF